MRRLVAAAVLPVVLLAGGCADDGAGDAGDPADPAATSTSGPATATTPLPRDAGVISRPEAETAAREAAARAVEEFGVSFEPGDFAAGCESTRGGDPAPTWLCEVDSGQCSGTLEVIAVEDGGTESRNEQVACGE